MSCHFTTRKLCKDGGSVLWLNAQDVQHTSEIKHTYSPALIHLPTNYGISPCLKQLGTWLKHKGTDITIQDQFMNYLSFHPMVQPNWK